MVFEEMGRTRGSLRALRAIVEQKLVQIEVDTIGPPTGEVQGSLSAAIEWLRSGPLPGAAPSWTRDELYDRDDA